MSKAVNKIISILISSFMVIPIVFVLLGAFDIDPHMWQRLWKSRIPLLLSNSALLVFVVASISLLLGASLAFLVEKTNLPFRHIFKPLLIAPLVIPCYIIAICYINFFGINGIGEKLFDYIGMDLRLPNIYGFWGATVILVIGSYPYVYTIVRASLIKLDSTYSDAARTLGASRFQRLTKITIPLLVPAFTAGTILIALYVLSDFGVVSMLRFPTFVSVIYDQISGRYDFSIATALSSVLIGMTICLFLLQESLVRQKQFVSSRGKGVKESIYNLKFFRIPAFIFVCFIIMIGLVIPLGILIYWMSLTSSVSQELSMWSMSFVELLKSCTHSLVLSLIAASLTVVMALPLAYWTVRQPKSKMGKYLSWAAQSGVALPGVLIALGLSLVFLHIAPRYNFSVMALICAFLVHFYAQGFQMIKAGLSQISERLEESAKLLGCSSLKAFWLISRPLLMPAIFTAWILVFLSSMRELPASLLLRPAGFDPLTVKIWISASEGFYEQAALPSLLLILLSLPLVIIVTKAKGNYQTSD